MADFTTDTMQWRATEHYARGYVDGRFVRATLVVPDTRPPLIRYIAKRMARVATPYWPCTDVNLGDDAGIRRVP